jgi:predicted PurR-regulated permease PerM
MMRSPTRPLAWLLSLMLVIMPVLPAQAAMVGTGDILNQQQTLADDRLQQFLDREATRAQLQEWGVSAEWVETRLNSLTDAELARIHSELDNLEAGGASILGVLVLIFIVFVITDVIGATDIFPFIHPVK